jgi:hypothetical protein
MMKIYRMKIEERKKVENVISISGRRDEEMSLAHSCILCEIECENPLRHRSHISSRLRPTESTVENEKKKYFPPRVYVRYIWSIFFVLLRMSMNQFLPFIIVVVVAVVVVECSVFFQ